MAHFWRRGFYILRCFLPNVGLIKPEKTHFSAGLELPGRDKQGCSIMRLHYNAGKTIRSSWEDTWLTGVYRIYDFCNIAGGMLKSIIQFLEEGALQLLRALVFRKDAKTYTPLHV